MFSNMVASLIQHGSIETTVAKAKELRGIVEKTITWGVKVSDIIGTEPKKLKPEERMRIVHAKRMAQRVCKNQEALTTLFDEVGPRFEGRPGGYTRIYRTRERRGDAAPMALIQLVEAGYSAPKKPKKKAQADASSD